MAGDFQQAIANHQKMIDELFAEQAKKKQAEADQARLKAESRKALMRFLEQFIDASIKFGTLKSEQVELYLTQYRIEYGDDALVARYIAIVVQLITHPLTGVESTTHRAGNGGLIWRGQTYQNTKKLYEAVVELMAGFDPLNSTVWFDYLLTEAFADETMLPAEVLLPRWRTSYVPKLRQLVELEKSSVQVPDIDSLTTDDLFIIQSLTGGF